jgi:hypothetical protein
MKRKIDPMNATPQEYLQHLKAIWTTHPYPDHIDDSVINELKKKFPRLLETSKKSPMETYNLENTIDDLYMDLAKPLKNRHTKLPAEGVAVGELQTLKVNSCCVAVPAGGYVILVNTGLMILLYQLTKVFASRIRVKADRETDIIVRDSGELLKTAKFTFQTIASYLLTNPSIGPRIPIVSMRKEQVSFVAGILHFAELFVLAHEFGHIIEGHFSTAKVMKIRTKEEDISLLKSNWNQEYEADLCGLQLVLETVTEKSERSLVRASSYMGPDLFFTFLDLIEKIGNIKPTSHPPAKLRRENIRKAMPPMESGLILGIRFQGLSELVWKTMSEK